MIIQSNLLILNPVISVIIPSYNRTDTVSQTIDSILNQQCDFPFEIIIGDDCSTDNVRGILIEYQKKYPEQIILLFQEKNLGLGGNWASCVKLARAKYVASCDDDDYWHNVNKLQIQVDYLESHPHTGMVHTEKNDYNVNNKKTFYNVNANNINQIPQGFIQKEIFAGKVPICVSTSLFRKDLIDKYVNLDNYIKLGFNIQDWPTWVIISKYCRIDYISISTCTYRIGHFGISNLQDYIKQNNKLSLDKRMYKYLCNMFPDDLQYDEKGYDIYVNGVLLSLAFKKNDFKKAKEFASYMLELGDKTLRTKLAVNWIGFHVFRILKGLKQKN